MNLTGGATCSPAGTVAEYRYLARAPGAAAYSEIRPYGTLASLGWTVTGLVAGLYAVAVQARAVGSTAAFETVTSTTVTVGSPPTCPAVILAASPVGSTVNLSAGATCSPAGTAAEYRFLARAPGAAAYSEIRAYGASGTFAWSTTGLPAGLYAVAVQSRATGSLAPAEGTTSTTVNVGGAAICAAASLAAAAGVGGLVNLSAGATCGGGTPEFRFLVRAPGASAYQELRPYGASAGLAWDTTGLAAGQWGLAVQARVQGSGALAEATTSTSYLVGASCSAATLALAQSGFTVTLTGGATCTLELILFRGVPAALWAKPQGAFFRS